MVSEEELSQMGPEELAEFQKRGCVFCQIASGKVHSRTVYSDDEVVAVLDINPAARGHMLLLPKEHFSVMPQLPEYLAEHLFMVTKGLSQAALKALQCKGTTLFVANGVAAGQKAPHFMIHIIPRSDNDGFSMAIPVSDFPKKDVDAIAVVLRKALGKGQVVEAEAEKKSADKTKKTRKSRVKGKKGSGRKGGKREGFDLDAVARMLSKG